MNRCASIAGLLLAMLIVSCASTQPAYNVITDRLYFGRAMPGDQVGTGSWRDFLRDVVTPRFPDGLTWWDAQGEWRDSTGQAAAERTFVLEIVRPFNTPPQDADTVMKAIINTYKTRYSQQAVLWVRSPGTSR